MRSKYYYCNNCQTFFDGDDENAYFEELHTELAGMGGNVTETFMCCPNCKGDDYEEAYVCLVCGDLTTNDDELCDDCKSAIVKRITPIIKELADELNVSTSEAEAGVYTYLGNRL